MGIDTTGQMSGPDVQRKPFTQPISGLEDVLPGVGLPQAAPTPTPYTPPSTGGGISYPSGSIQPEPVAPPPMSQPPLRPISDPAPGGTGMGQPAPPPKYPDFPNPPPKYPDFPNPPPKYPDFPNPPPKYAPIQPPKHVPVQPAPTGTGGAMPGGNMYERQKGGGYVNPRSWIDKKRMVKPTAPSVVPGPQYPTR